VIADIPGIIEGAASGQGLGLQFLKHVERTRALLHIVTLDPDPEREPVRDFDKLMHELDTFDPELKKRPMIVGISKLDIPEVRERESEIRQALEARGLEVFPFCSATHEGVEPLLVRLERMLIDNPTSFARKPAKHPSASERPELHGSGRPPLDASD
jgi:GTP-binding protein